MPAALALGAGINAFSRVVSNVFRPVLSLPYTDAFASPNWFNKTPTATAAYGLSDGTVTLTPAAGAGNVARLDLIVGDIVGDFELYIFANQLNTTANDSGFVIGVGDGGGSGLLPTNAVGARMSGGGYGLDRNAAGAYTFNSSASTNLTAPGSRILKMRRQGNSFTMFGATSTDTGASWSSSYTYTDTLPTIYIGAYNGASTNVSFQFTLIQVEKCLILERPGSAGALPSASIWSAPKGSGTIASGSFGIRFATPATASAAEWIESLATFTDDIDVLLQFYATTNATQVVYAGFGSGADSTGDPTTAVRGNLNINSTASSSSLSVQQTTTGTSGLATVGSAVTKTMNSGSNFAIARIQYIRATGVFRMKYWYFGSTEPTAWDITQTTSVLTGGLYFYVGLANGPAATACTTAFSYISVNQYNVTRMLQSWNGSASAFDQAVVSATTTNGAGQTPVSSVARNAPAQLYHSKVWSHSGSMSGQWNLGSGTALYAVMPFAIPLNATGYLREYVMMPAASISLAKRMYEFRDASNVLVSALSIGSNNLINLTNSSGVVIWTSTNVLPHDGSTTRIEMQMNVGAGTARVMMFAGESLTSFEDSGPLTIVLGSSAINTIRLGSSGGSSAAYIWYRDDIAFDSNTLGWIGPKLVAPANESFTAANGTAVTTGQWEQSIGGVGTMVVQSNQLLCTPTNQPGTGYGVNSYHYTGTGFLGNTDVTATIILSSTSVEQYQGIGINLDPLTTASGQSANSWHTEFNVTNGTFELYYGSFISVASVAKSYTTAPWKVRLQRIGSIVKAKAWLASNAEPASWDITYDAAANSRALGIGVVNIFNQNGGAGTSVPVTVDDVYILAA